MQINLGDRVKFKGKAATVTASYNVPMICLEFDEPLTCPNCGTNVHMKQMWVSPEWDWVKQHTEVIFSKHKDPETT